MHDPRTWLVQHLEAAFTQPEGEIAVLAIGRRVAFVEPAHGVEQDARYQQRCRRAVVNLAQIVVGGPIRAIEPAVIPARAIVPDDAARLLQPAVRIQQLGADRADVTAESERQQQRIEPVRQHLRVVVQQQQELALGDARGGVAGAQIAEVARIDDPVNQGTDVMQVSSSQRRFS